MQQAATALTSVNGSSRGLHVCPCTFNGARMHVLVCIAPYGSCHSECVTVTETLPPVDAAAMLGTSVLVALLLQRLASYTPLSDAAPRQQLLATPGSAGRSSWTASPGQRWACTMCGVRCSTAGRIALISWWQIALAKACGLPRNECCLYMGYCGRSAGKEVQGTAGSARCPADDKQSLQW